MQQQPSKISNLMTWHQYCTQPPPGETLLLSWVRILIIIQALDPLTQGVTEVQGKDSNVASVSPDWKAVHWIHWIVTHSWLSFFCQDGAI